MRWQKTIVFTVLVLLLQGCNPVIFPVPTGTPLPITSPIPTSTPLRAQIPSATTTVTLTVPPTSFPVQTVSSTPQDPPCPEFVAVAQLQDISRQGTVVLNEEGGPPYLLDLGSGVKRKLPFIDQTTSRRTSGMRVSPDGDKLAYFENSPSGVWNETDIWVVDSEAKVLARRHYTNNLFPWRWLNEEFLQIYRADTKMDGSLYILNPITNEQEVLSPRLPDFYPYQNWDLWPSTWLVEYNNDTSYIVYLAELPGSGLRLPILWNRSTSREVWRSKGSGGLAILREPVWSPKGDEFLIKIDDLLYRIDIDGKEHPLILPETSHLVDAFEWSPDGSKIALWTGDYGPNRDRIGPLNDSLQVYDVGTGKFTDLCVQDQFISDTTIQWSDNGRFIFDTYTIKQPDQSYLNTAIVVDLQNFRAYQIPESILPRRWFDSSK